MYRILNSLNSTENDNDSIIYTNLIVEQSFISNDTITTNSAIFWNGLYLDTTGDYSIDLISSLGCDSIVNLNLTIIDNTSILNHYADEQKEILKVINVLGQKTNFTRNSLLIYIYDDGTVEKKILLK